jgi:hypothetical protein
MGTDGPCGLLFCAAKRSGTFTPNMPAGLRARVAGFRATVATVYKCFEMATKDPVAPASGFITNT